MHAQPRFNLLLQEEALAAAQARKRARQRRARSLAREGNSGPDGGKDFLARVVEEEEEQADAALLGLWGEAGRLSRGVDRRIEFVGGLLTAKVRYGTGCV